ncbi:TPA: hypothetical protein ACTW94_000589 [Raoultella ornithinolytica]
MKSQRNNFLLLVCLFAISYVFIENKPYFEENTMAVDNEYLITETPLIIHDYRGDKYSILPEGVALYPIVGDNKPEGEYMIYVNYQSLSGELEYSPDTADSSIINELYLSKPPADFKVKDNKVITKNDLVHLLQKSTLTKKDFSEIISEFDE